MFYEGISDNKCGWVNHNGHSSTEFSVGTVTHRSSAFYSMACMGVLSENIWADCNGTASNYFFFTSGGCYNASFDNFCPPGTGLPYEYATHDCWAATVTRMGTGPVALIGNARFGMGDNDGTDGPSDRPIRWIHDAMFNPDKKIHYAGHMLANAKESDITRITLSDVPNNDITQDSPYWGAIKYTNYELNLFGDPALSIWTDTPQELTLNPQINGNQLTVDTKGPYSWVALISTDDDEIIYTQQTGIDGQCAISDPILEQYIQDHQDGTIKVCVKSHNYLPKTITVNISTSIKDKQNLMVENFGAIHSKNSRVTFSLKKAGYISIKLYNLKGSEIASLVNGNVDRGNHSISLPHTGISSGIYYCKFVCGSNHRTVKFMLHR